MRRILSIVMVLAMIASIASVAAFADGELNKIFIKASAVEVEEGATEIVVPITVEYTGENGLLATMFTIEVEGATLTKLSKGSVITGQYQADLAQGTVMIVNGADIDESIPSASAVVYATLTLTAPAKKDDSVKLVIKPGPPANFCDAELNDQQGIGGEFDVLSIATKSIMPGDVDESGDLNAKDIIFIMKYIISNKTVKPIANFVVEAADFDNDGDINAKDIIKIMKQIIEDANTK